MPKRVDHAERRRLLTGALERVAAQRGARAATMREVAAEAGVSVGLVQHYFPSKDDLVLAALGHLAERAGVRVQRAVRSLGEGATERDRIRVTLLQLLPLDDERRAASVLFRSYHEAGVNDPATTGFEAHRVPQLFHAGLVRRLEAARAAGQLRDDVAPEGEAAIYQAVITSLAESVLAGLTSAAQARAIVDYMLDRAFLPSS